ncbi:MAG: hypothetical protein R2824_12490 [Saprospiraceae bacterium]|nr:hypothetical protein [Lewinella sp.]
MDKLHRHIPRIFLLLLIFFLAFIYRPESTDNGEEKETVFDEQVHIEVDEQADIVDAEEDTVTVAPEQRDELKKGLDTVPLVQEEKVLDKEL